MSERGQRLFKAIRKLVSGINLDEAEVSGLDGLVRKVLADVDVLSTLPSADDGVPPSMQAAVSW